jgi:hypothetical protein
MSTKVFYLLTRPTRRAYSLLLFVLLGSLLLTLLAGGPVEALAFSPGPGGYNNPGAATMAGPTNPSWTSPALLGPASPEHQALWRPFMRTRPTDGVAFIVGETAGGSKAAPPSQVLLFTSTDPAHFTTIQDSPAAPPAYIHPNISFARDGSAFIAWRDWPEQRSNWLRKLKADGTLMAGFDVYDKIFARTQNYLDQPAIALSPAPGKLYLTGQGTFAPNQWMFVELASDGTQNGTAVVSSFDIGSPRPQPNDIQPVICVDKNDNVSVVGNWDGSMYARTRYNHQWGPLTLIGNSGADHFYYKYKAHIACGEDGYVYAAWRSQGSVALARFTPGTGWQNISKDLFNSGSFHPNFCDLTVTPDGAVWLAVSGEDTAAGQGGTFVTKSDTRGTGFAPKQLVIPHQWENEGVSIDYSPANRRLYVMTTFVNPRESFLVSATLSGGALPAVAPKPGTPAPTIVPPTLTARPTLTAGATPARATPAPAQGIITPKSTTPAAPPASSPVPPPPATPLMPDLSCEAVLGPFVECINAIYRLLGLPPVTATQLCQAIKNYIPTPLSRTGSNLLPPYSDGTEVNWTS